jgi:predicted HicB family RNase H-like nuclease
MALKAGRPSSTGTERIERAKAELAKAEPERRLNVRMPKSEYRKLQRYALEHELSISQVVRAALSEYMSK